MARRDDGGAALGEPLDGRERGADARVVGDRRAVDPLLRLLTRHPTGHIALAAVTALGVIGDETAVPVMIEMLKKRDTQAHYVAAEALAEIGNPAVDALVEALDTQDPDLTVAIIEILGKIGDARAVSTVIGIFSG